MLVIIVSYFLMQWLFQRFGDNYVPLCLFSIFLLKLFIPSLIIHDQWFWRQKVVCLNISFATSWCINPGTLHNPLKFSVVICEKTVVLNWIMASRTLRFLLVEPMNITLYANSAIKLRMLKWGDYFGLSRHTLNVRTSVLIRRR